MVLGQGPVTSTTTPTDDDFASEAKSETEGHQMPFEMLEEEMLEEESISVPQSDESNIGSRQQDKETLDDGAEGNSSRSGREVDLNPDEASRMETDTFADDTSSIRGKYDSGSDSDSPSVEDEDMLEEYSKPRRTRRAPHHLIYDTLGTQSYQQQVMYSSLPERIGPYVYTTY